LPLAGGVMKALEIGILEQLHKHEGKRKKAQNLLYSDEL
jgi:hypothetical protein